MFALIWQDWGPLEIHIAREWLKSTIFRHYFESVTTTFLAVAGPCQGIISAFLGQSNTQLALVTMKLLPPGAHLSFLICSRLRRICRRRLNARNARLTKLVTTLSLYFGRMVNMDFRLHKTQFNQPWQAPAYAVDVRIRLDKFNETAFLGITGRRCPFVIAGKQAGVEVF